MKGGAASNDRQRELFAQVARARAAEEAEREAIYKEIAQMDLSHLGPQKAPQANPQASSESATSAGPAAAADAAVDVGKLRKAMWIFSGFTFFALLAGQWLTFLGFGAAAGLSFYMVRRAASVVTEPRP